jgi:two-component system response regulator
VAGEKEIRMNDETILLVEDNPDDELLTRRALKKSGIPNRVAVVRDGAEALDLLLGAEELPRMVLLDLNLPKVDGLEVLRRLRADARTRSLPVVVLVSPREGEQPPGGGDNVWRADICIDKGVDYDAFQRAVRRLRALLSQAAGPWAASRRRPSRVRYTARDRCLA